MALAKPPFPILQRGHPQAQLLSAGWPVYEGSGTTLHDLSGNGNDGGLHGGVTWVDGPWGKCLSLDGTGWASVTDSALLKPAKLSVGLWFNSTQANLGRIAIKTSIAGGAEAWGVSLNLSNGSGIISATINSSALRVDSLGVVNDGRWHHVFFTYDLVALTLFVDGVLQATVAGSQAIDYGSNLPLQIGRYSTVISQAYTGSLDSPKIYPFAASAAQVAADYADSFAYCRPRRRVLRGPTGPVFAPGGLAFSVPDRPSVFQVFDRPAVFAVPDRPATFQVPA